MKKHVMDTRLALLEAAVQVMGRQGYNGTSVDDICRAAGVTKGSFFHYFASKEGLAIAAAEYFAAELEARLGQADYRTRLDPKERVLGYVDERERMLRGELPDFACLPGMLGQEVHATHPGIREACGRLVVAHAARLESDLRAAKALYAPRADWEVKRVATHVEAVLQGAFVMAKVTGKVDVAIDTVGELRRYVQGLLPRVSV